MLISLMCEGFPWPNPDCPVALVECDRGQEVKGDLSRQSSTLATESLQAGATSYCNLVEASLAIRSDSIWPRDKRKWC